MKRISREKGINDEVEQIAASIRKKYLALKLGKSEADEEIQKFFKPVVEPLTTLVKNTSDESRNAGRSGRLYPRLPATMKSSTHEAKARTSSLADMTTIVEERQRPPKLEIVKKPPSDQTFVFNPAEEEEEEVFKPDVTLGNVARGVSLASLGEYLSQYPDLVKPYIDRYIENSDEFDATYGLNNDPELDKWTMGSKEVIFNKDNSITIDGKQYPGTKGLYELLFMKEPIDQYVSEQDLAFYKDILERTCAHRHGFTPIGAIKGTNLQKYRVYVKPLVNPKKPNPRSSSSSIPSPTSLSGAVPRRTGKGLMLSFPQYKLLNRKPVDYLYWNSLNELVDRLRIIYAEIIAGNKAHWNEASSIVEELLETGKVYKLRGGAAVRSSVLF